VRADGLVRPGKKPFLGDNTDNSTGATQSATATTTNREAVRFTNCDGPTDRAAGRVPTLWHTSGVVEAGGAFMSGVRQWGLGGWGLGTALVAASIVVTAAPVSGDANEAPVGNIPATALTAGEEHVCVVLLGGDVACWGGGSSGQLGNGSSNDIGDGLDEMGANLRTVELGAGRTATAVVGGGEHSCALLDDATVKCWGGGVFGALGLGDNEDRGRIDGQLGNNLPAVDLGTGRTATAITAGNQHTCAILDNSTVKCWGDNIRGQLGLGDTARRGDDPGEMGNGLPTVDFGTGRTATAITAGTQHTCAILDDRTVKCWGDNFFGQLGLGDTARRGDDPGEMGNGLPTVDLGTGRTATAITAGDDHTCALLDNSTVKCWGYNSNGQLGLGDGDERGSAASQMGNDLPTVDLGTGRTATAITTGDDHTCALLDDATVKCWGDGSVGQLGQAGDVDLGAGLGDEPDEMGDDLPPIDLTRPVGRPALTLDLTANRSRVVATTPLVYTVTVRNTGSIPLTDIAITTPDTTPATTTCTRAVPFLAPQTTTTYTCRHTTTSANTPQITHQLLATAAQGPVALSPRTRTRVDARIVRADGLIRPGKKAFVGDNTYNSTGAAQTATASATTKAVRYTWRIQNDGNTVDRFVLRSTKGTRAFTVTYRRGRADITAAVRAGTYTTSRLAPGKRTDITVTVRPTKRARTGDALSLGLTARSATVASATDTVRATTTRR
jgi:alpha-tubulin suppressor-like RCC1 family protein